MRSLQMLKTERASNLKASTVNLFRSYSNTNFLSIYWLPSTLKVSPSLVPWVDNHHSCSSCQKGTRNSRRIYSLIFVLNRWNLDKAEGGTSSEDATCLIIRCVKQEPNKAWSLNHIVKSWLIHLPILFSGLFVKTWKITRAKLLKIYRA